MKLLCQRIENRRQAGVAGHQWRGLGMVTNHMSNPATFAFSAATPATPATVAAAR
jgi:hypothetical protein